VSSAPPPATEPAVEPEPEPVDPIIARLADLTPDGVSGQVESVDGLTLIVPRERLLAVGQALRDDPDLAFIHCSDVTAVDYLDQGREPRFDLVYHLLSRALKRRIRLRVPLDEDEPIVPSVTGIWPTANWLERETNDMFGIGFAGHPDPRRILLPDDFEGHPLRKDFPLGSEEIAFSHNQDRLYEGYPDPNEGHPPFER
jgi:NADH-quinone oxidoreductase subunit C